MPIRLSPIAAIPCVRRQIRQRQCLPGQGVCAVGEKLNHSGLDERVTTLTLKRCWVIGSFGVVGAPAAWPLPSGRIVTAGDENGGREGRRFKVAVKPPAGIDNVHFLAALTPIREPAARNAAELGRELSHHSLLNLVPMGVNRIGMYH